LTGLSLAKSSSAMLSTAVALSNCLNSDLRMMWTGPSQLLCKAQPRM
jgi:hypothetical protein